MSRIQVIAPFENQGQENGEFIMLTGRKQQIALASFILGLALALWGCVGTINPSSNYESDDSGVRDPAGKPIRHRGAIGDVFRDGDGNGAAHLPVAEKQRQPQRRNDILNLHDAGNSSGGAAFQVVVSSMAGSAAEPSSATLTVDAATWGQASRRSRPARR